ncbi:MAG: hypothetical protein UT43_C0017G0022 [Parcubacteria group bacterium GW2011_GWC1_39_29]|uniref:Uncharacterized protein n=1 Tax=Candidatus Yanofskybacteria bacterium GW2011_GWD1_39_16 TaxID=1619030 RepID=A0A837HUN2_9BACT|nr:MAG: hypothetical protein UT35_C0002G0021 [Candidatus Yanofskybacteria bacterium GW2011_GWD1_39_16]KKR14751.1 MAG: hypothetical protein UT43_C0017G0022 [Parcubacteria group bacterium GW2011_GWC1_39_29]
MKKLYDYATECITELGNLVGKMRKKGEDIGLTESQTKKVWVTAFDVLAKKQKISRQIMSQNLSKKTSPPENV